ncbi:serine/threonine-protein kinase [Streptomyces sp. NPDC050428]|uniref:serine/threonine-protein kinase n=1 Tax=Streptomyces sp. NPDC050428 TaxID=3155757 RepID=UPI003448CA39
MEPLEPGDPRHLGQYRILARIGAGGMATVYLARSRGGRAVAVKAVHAQYAQDPFHRGRFRSEVTAATAVGGMHSPPVLDSDTDAASPWMATEFLPAVSLREAVERYGPLPAGSVRRLAAGLAEALAAFHRTGIVHLDVKPANVLLTVDGPRLIDFGIAATARSTGPAGSRGFMSPEQMTGEAGPPSDVYSLGATLEYALGERERERENGDRERERDEELAAVIADCRRSPASARPTAAELTLRLSSLAPHPPGSADGPWLPPAVLGAIDRNASAAVNPPEPVPVPRPLVRRRLLAGGIGALALAGGAAVFAALGDEGGGGGADELAGGSRAGGGGEVGSANSQSPSASPPPSPSAPAKPVVLELSITGDGPLNSLTYAVNGRLTTLKNVPLPWRKTVEVPRSAGSVDWRLRFTFPAGEVRSRVLRDGSSVYDESYPIAAARGFPNLYPHDVDTGGSSAISGSVPGEGV